MTISVCMGTYNGENYIEQQLKSLLNQTREPDEVIICDDNSDDKTAEIIRRFIDVNHLQDSWKLYCNNQKDVRFTNVICVLLIVRQRK